MSKSIFEEAQDIVRNRGKKVPTSIEELKKSISAKDYEEAIMNKPAVKLKPPSIEEAAAKYAKDYNGMQWEKDRVEIAYIKGAKSDAAKEYWYQQFKQEKK